MLSMLEHIGSRKIMARAVEAGINFFDTANVYADGASEEITGRALKDMARRDEVVIATKAWGSWGKGPNQGGLSRKALLQAVDDSLRRLGTDYIDLYQIHRWDGSTPIEETIETLNDIVRAGKARYIGASSMYAWQFQKALLVSERNGWARFVSMQNHYNLLAREEGADSGHSPQRAVQLRDGQRIGYDHLIVYDHVLGAVHEGREPKLTGPYTEKHPFHDPFTMFSYLAGLTTKLEFVSGVIILPQRQTALVARQAADVDLLSGGRLRLGVGIGWNHVEYDALGQDFRTR